MFPIAPRPPPRYHIYMLAIIVGGTPDERLEARSALANGVQVEEIDENVSPDEIAGMAGTMTLMGDTKVFLLRRVLSPKRAVAEVSEEENESGESAGSTGFADKSAALCDIAEGLVQSPHAFIFEEDTLTAKLQTKLEKAGAKLRMFEKIKKAEPLNMFALGDAMARGDRKTFWLLLMKARESGILPEQICGILAWKARTMLTVSYTNPERAICRKLSRQVVMMYHESHRGAGDLWLLLEQFALIAR